MSRTAKGSRKPSGKGSKVELPKRASRPRKQDGKRSGERPVGALSAARAVPRVVRTTVGDLVAAVVDTAGARAVPKLFGRHSPLARVLRQRLVIVDPSRAGA